MPYRRSAIRKPKVMKRKVMRKAKRGKVAGVSKAVQKWVKQTISSRIEDKHASPYSLSNQGIVCYTNSATPSTVLNLTTVLSNITQGTGQGNRIGNQIRVKSLRFQGYVNMIWSTSTFSQVNVPVYLKMYIGRKAYDLNAPNDQSSMYVNGSTNLAPTNLPPDMYRRVNTDLFRVFATRLFKLGVAPGTPTASTAQVPNNDFKLSQTFDVSLNKHVNVVKYDDGSSAPTNCAFYVWFALCAYDGSTINATTAAPAIEIHFDTNAKFEDA